MSIKPTKLIICCLLACCLMATCKKLSFDDLRKPRIKGDVLNILSDVSFVYNDPVLKVCSRDMTKVFLTITIPGIVDYYRYDSRDMLFLIKDNNKHYVVSFYINASNAEIDNCSISFREQFRFEVRNTHIGYYEYIRNYKNKIIILYDSKEISYYNIKGDLVKSYSHNSDLYFINRGIRDSIDLYAIDNTSIYLVATIEHFDFKYLYKYSEKPCLSIQLEDNTKDQSRFVSLGSFYFIADKIVYLCDNDLDYNLSVNKIVVDDFTDLVSDNIIQVKDGYYIIYKSGINLYLSHFSSSYKALLKFTQQEIEHHSVYLMSNNDEYMFMSIEESLDRNTLFLKYNLFSINDSLTGILINHEERNEVYTDDIILYSDKYVYKLNIRLDDFPVEYTEVVKTFK